MHMLNDCHLLLLLGFKKSVYFKWELWRTAQHSCKLFQISFYKFTSYRLCVLYHLTISLLCSICLMSVTHPQKMNKLKIQSKLFYTPYLNFLTNITHSPFQIFIYLQENTLDAWPKKKLHATHRHISTFLQGTLQKIINIFHNEHV